MAGWLGQNIDTIPLTFRQYSTFPFNGNSDTQHKFHQQSFMSSVETAQTRSKFIHSVSKSREALI